MAKQKNPFSVRFTREALGDGKSVYITTVRVGDTFIPVQTTVDEKKAAADGLDTSDIALSVKANHYNVVEELLHKALVKGLGIKA